MFFRYNFFSDLLACIASDLAAILMAFTTVSAKTGFLLEHLLATVDATDIWVMLCVHVNVFHKILALGELSRANLALKSSYLFVHIDKVAL